MKRTRISSPHTPRSAKPRPLSRSLVGFKSTAAICAALIAAGASARADVTWTGGTDFSWDTGANWSPTALAPTASDAVTFSLGNGATITLNSGEVALSLNFLDNYTLTGGSLGLGAGGNITVGAGKTDTIASVLTGSNGLTYNGNSTGALVLSGVNTYTGGTTLTSGTLDINNASALGGITGNTFTINGGTIDNTSGAAITTSNYAQAWNGDFTFGGTNALNLGTGAVTLSGNRQLTVNGTGANGTLTVGGVISGTGFGITKTGTGTLVLNGVNTYTGATTITAGTLSTNSVTGGSGSGLGNAASAVTLGGTTTTGTLSYTGNSASYTRGFTINAGGGEVDVTTGGQTLTISTPLALTSGGLTFGGAGNVTVSTAATVPFTGTNALNKTGAGTFTIQTTTVAGTAAAMPINIAQGTLTSNVSTKTNMANPLGTGTITFTPGSGAGATLNISEVGATDTFANPIAINNGTGSATIQNSSGVISFGSAVTFAAGAATPTLQLINTNTAAGSNLTFSGGFTGSGNITLNGTAAGSGFVLQTGSVNNTGTITNLGSNAGGAVTISSVIGANVTGLTQNGAAPMTLSAANLYSGATTVTSGTLTASVAGAIPAASSVLVNGGTLTSSVTGAVGGNITISSGTVSANAAGALGGSVTINGGTLLANTAAGAIMSGTLTLNSGLLNSVAGASLGPVVGGSGVNTISVAGAASLGQLTLSSLSTGSGTVLQFDAVAPWISTPATTGDLLVVSGNNGLSLANGTTLAFSNGLPTAAGEYRLIQYSGAMPTLPSSLLPTSPRSGISYTFDTSSDAGYIDLIVANTSTALTSGWVPTAAGSFSWATSANWTGGVPSLSGDTATFATNIGANAQTVTLDGGQHVGTLLLNPTVTTGSYTIAAGTAGTLSFDNGASAAQVTNSAGNNTISAPVFLTSSNTNFDIASGTGLTISGAIAGSGKITMTTDSGTLTLGSANSFTGGIEIDSGTVVNPSTSMANLGGGTANVLINGGTLSFTANTTTNNVGLAGEVFTIGPNGGTINTTGTVGSTSGKLLLGQTGNLAGTGLLTKTGGGDMQISGANAGFTGNVLINNGEIEVQNAAALGTVGTITIASGGELVGSLGGGIIANPLVITGTGILSANSNNTTFSGGLSVPATGTFTMAARQFQTTTTGTTFTLTGDITGAANLALSTSQTALGTVILAGNNTGWSTTQGSTLAQAFTLGSFQGLQFDSTATTNARPGGVNGVFITFNGTTNPTFGLGSDGDGWGTANVAATYSDTLTFTTSGTVVVGRAGVGIPLGSSLFTQAVNKTIQESNAISLGNVTMTVTNNNGYGLQFLGGVTLSSTPTFSVANASTSNAVAGLTLSGQVTGVGFTKAGAGTMILANASNSFTGNVTVTGGVLGATSDAALGTSTNAIVLNGATGMFEAFGTYSTSRTFTFSNGTASNNLIGVAPGQTLTITSAFSGTNGFQKADSGTLILSGSNGAYTAGWTASGGITRLTSAVAGGTGTITIAGNSGTTLQLDGTSGAFSLPNALSIGATTGINSAGAVENFVGNNTLAGAITLTGAASIGADAGTTLAINGGITGAQALTFTGNGAINIGTAAIGAVSSITKIGSGTTTLGIASPLYVSALNVNAGTFVINSTATLGTAAVANSVSGGALLKVDDTTATANRLGTTRTMSLSAGTFEYQANSAASSESTGALTSAAGGNTIQIDTTTVGTSSLTFASLTMSTGTTLTFNAGGSGKAFGTSSNTLLFTGAPTLTSANIGIIPRAIIIDANGVNFATYNSTGIAANTAGVQALANYDIPSISSTTVVGTAVTVADTSVLSVGMAVYGPNIPAGTTIASITGPTTYTLSNAATAAGTVNLAYGSTGYTDVNSAIARDAVADNVKLGTGFVTTGNAVAGTARTFNSLYLTGSSTLDAAVPGFGTTVTLTSGNILAAGGGTTTVGSNIIVASGGTELGLNVAANSTLAINGILTSSGAVTKGLAGNLTFNTPQYFNTGATNFNINGGTVTLNGGNNTLFPGAQGGTGSSYIAVGPGATLDLNGNSQMIGSLRSSNNTGIVGSGGTVTTSAGTATLVDAGGQADNFGGQITGNIFFVKTGTNSLSLYNDNTFTGGLVLMGGTTTLLDSGKLSGLSASTPININSATLAISNTGTLNLFDRIGDSVPITLRAGAISFAGRAQTASTETLGALTFSQGSSDLNVTAGGTGINSADLIFASITQGSIDATLNFRGGAGQIGSNPRIQFTTAPTLTNNILSPSIQAGGNDWATYIPGLGLAALNAAGAPGYDGATFPAINQPTQNIKLAAAGAVPSGGLTLNTLNVTAANVTFTGATDVLNLAAGGLLHTGATSSIGATVDSGMLTAGGASASGTVPFYVYNGANGFTLNSRIVDPNASSHLRLVLTNFNAGSITLTDGANSYSGGTVVDGWIGGVTGAITLGGAAGQVVIPAGGLTLTNALVTEQTNGGQINASNAVMMNGSSTLTLVGANTLDSLVFNNNGGTTNPSVVSGGVLSLTNATPISVTSSNPSTVPTVSGTLDFANLAKTISVGAITINSQALAPYTAALNISAAIQNSGQITKTGAGNLQLSSTGGTFSGGVNLSSGGLIIGASSAPSTAGSVLAAGPLGIGTLTIGSGTTLLSSASANAVANPMSILGDFTFNGINNLALNGSTTLPAGVNTNITVATPQMSATLGGIISGVGSSITKVGPGTLVLGNSNTFNGGVTLNAGTLLATGASPFGSGAVTINGGVLQLHNNVGGYYNNAVTINSSLSNAYIDINNNGSNTNMLFTMGTLTEQPTTVLNVSGGNGYKIQFSGTNLTSLSTAASFNPASGLTIILPGGFNDTNRPLNVGLGMLAFSGNNTFTTNTTITGTQTVAPQANSVSTPYGSGAIILGNGSTLLVTPTPGALTNAGYTQGGVSGRFYGWAGTGPSLATPGATGAGPAGVVGGMSLSDGNLSNHAAGVMNASGAQSSQDTEEYTGLLNIATGGTYTFGLNADDQAELIIDGAVIHVHDAVGGSGGYSAGFSTGTITLSAGYHQIVLLHQNGGGGSGVSLIYNGPDTNTGSQASPGWQTISSSSLYYNTGGGVGGAASASNNYLNAAQVNNAVQLGAGNTATLDGQGTGYNSTFQSLTLGAGSTLIVNNTEGTGFIGSLGATTIQGTGVTLNTAGVLNLIGGVSDGGSGVTKIGVGTLMLGPSGTNFTGTLAINQGTVQISDSTASTGSASTALPTTGGTTVGTQITVSTGNSWTASTSNITVASTAGLFPGEVVTGTGIPAGAYIVSITNGTTYVLSATPTAAGTSALTYSSGATLDLNGSPNVGGGTITLNGAGPKGTSGLSGPAYGASSATGAALYNSIALPSIVSANVRIGSALNGTNPAIGGFGDINITGTVTDGGSAQAWSKVGPDILTLSNSGNTFTGAVTVSGGILKVADPSALGTDTTNGVTVSSGAVFDLGGQSLTLGKTLTINGTGITGLAMNNTLASLINSGAAAASYAGPVTLGAASSIGSSSYVSGSGGGDISLGGVVSGAFVLTKVGTDTLTLTNAANSFTNFVVNSGTLTFSGTGAETSAAGTNTVLSGGTLILDNSNSAVASRMGGRGLINDGVFKILANTGGNAVTETISQTGQNLNSSNSQTSFILDASAANAGPITLTVNSTNAALFTRAGNATSVISGTNLGVNAPGTAGSANITAAGATTSGTAAGNGVVGQTATSGTNRLIYPWALVDTTAGGTGISFATYGTNGVQALNFTGNTDGVINALTANANVLSTTGVSTTAASGVNSINSLTLNGAGAMIGAGSTLTLGSGGLLNLTGSIGTPNTISGSGILSTGANVELIVHVTGTSALNISSQIASTTGGLTKADNGTLILSTQEMYTGNTIVNAGTLQLAGGNQTLFITPNAGQSPGVQNFTTSGQVLQVNRGATVDLNGTTQMVANINSANTLPNTGGTITNSSSTVSNFQTVFSANQTFAGSITGNLNFYRTSGYIFTLESASTYSGTTTIQGGNTVLQDLGALTNTSGISLNGGALTWTDSGTQAVTNRLPSTAPITFNTGAFIYNARSGTQGAISLGNITLNSGSSLMQINPLNGGANVTIGTGTGAPLTHNVGGTITFNSSTTNGGVGDNGHVFLNGTQPTANGIIGGWATVYQVDGNIAQTVEPGFAVNTSNGIVALNPNLTVISTGSVPTGANARVTANLTLPAGGVTLNTVTVPNTASTLTFSAASDTLTITTGGFLTNVATTIGASAGQGNLTAGAGQSELFLHSGTGTLTVNSKIIDNGVSGGLNVVADPMAGAGTLVLDAPNNYLGTTYFNNIGVTLNATGGPAIPGNLVITGGVSASDSTNATTTFSQSNQIATGATVTLNGGGVLSLNGFNNTIANLVINNTSGDLSGVGGTVTTGSGMLTISGGITVNPGTDSFIVPQINGFVTLSGASPTISVGGNSLAPGQVNLDLAADLTLTASTNTALVLTGGGIIAINGQSSYANGTSVASGTTLAFGPAATTTGAAATYASIVNSKVSLASGATFDLRGNAGVIGSLAGSGTVTNTALVAGTLTTGFDNTNAVFSGALLNPFVQGLLSITKVGTGDWNLTANNSGANLNSPNLGTLTVEDGSVTLNGTGALGFGTYTLQTGATLNINNTTSAVSNRLGAAYLSVSPTVATATTTARALNFQGGQLAITGNSGTAITEALGALNITGGGTIVLNAAGTAGITASWTSITNQSQSTSLFILGDGLGSAAGAGVAALTGTTTFRGNTAGTNGTATMPVREDIIMDTNASDTTFTGTGIGFLTKDSSTGLLRPLNQSTELLSTLLTGVTNQTNVGLSSAATGALLANSNPGTLTLLSGGGVSNGIQPGSAYGASGLLTLTLQQGGLLAFSGNTGVNAGVVTNGDTADIHVLPGATLNLNAALSTNNSFVKADGGTLVLNQPFYNLSGSQTVAVNGGTLKLAAGDNTLWVQPTATIPTAMTLAINNGTVDLNGTNQSVSGLTNTNPLPYAGGTAANPNSVLTNTSSTPVNFYDVNTGTTTTTFGGVISGNISFYKEQTTNNQVTLIFTSPQTYTGQTVVANGTLALRDLGAIASSQPINLNYGGILIDNTGLADSTTRINPSAPINFNAGILSVAAGQAVETENIGTATLGQGYNIINISQYNNNAATGSYTLNIANLVQQNNAVLNFTNGTGVTLGATGANPHITLNQLNGSTFSTANLTNGMIGGWATVNGTDFAGYVTGQGVGALGSTGFPAYATNAITAGVATDNVSTTATTNAITARTINSWKVNAAAATVLTMNDLGQTLTIGTGGLLTASTTNTVTINGGALTAGTSSAPASLYVFTNGSSNTPVNTINSTITNNSNNGVVSLVRSGGGALTLAPQAVVPAATYASGASSITMNSATGATGLFIGEVISGTGIAANTTITNIAGNVITLSAATTAAGTGPVNLAFSAPTIANSTTTSGSVSVTLGSSAPAGITAGMAVGGPNIAPGTTVVSVSGTTLTLSQPAIASGTTASITLGAPSNTYTGATVNNGGASVFGLLNLSGQAGSIVIPGDLTISNTNVTENTNQGQIAPTSNVRWVGGGTLTLTGSNTLASLSFKSIGTSGGTETMTGGTVNLTSANAITSQNDFQGTTPLVASAVNFVYAGASTITTTGLSPNDLQITGQITAPNGLIKAGTGSLTLPNANAATINWTLNAGTLILGNATALGATGSSLTINGAGTLMGSAGTPVVSTPITFNAGSSLAFGGTGGTVTNAINLSGAMNINGASPNISVNAATLTDTISGAISGTGGFTKTGPGTLTISSASNSYSGLTTVAGGILKIGNTAAIPASTSDVSISAGAELDINGSANVILRSIAGSGIITDSGAAATFYVGGTSTTDNTSTTGSTFGGVITNGTNALALTKVGNNRLTLSGANSYTGGTTIITGTVLVNNNTALGAATGALTMGDVSGNAATLNLQTFNQTVGSLTVKTSSNTNTNTITVAPGNTFTVNGNVTIGPTTPSATLASNLTIGGGGSLLVSAPTNGVFQVGGSTTGTTGAAGDNSMLDLTGLNNVTINLGTTGTGVLRVNNPQPGNTTGVQSTLLLPTPTAGITSTTPVTTITAPSLNVGDNAGNNGGGGQINSMILGTGLTTLNVSTVNIGTGGRDLGLLAFTSGNGTVKLRAADGVSRATMNIATGTATTGVAVGSGLTGSVVDLTGHNADLLLSALNVGNQARNSTQAADFKFDTGTLDTTGITIGFDTNTFTATNSPVLTDTVTISGGTVTVGASAIDMGSITDTSTGARSVVGKLNVTGGNVTVGSNGTFAVRLGNNTAASGVETTNDTLSVTGGTVTLQGDIITSSTTRTTSTVTLNGGTLDLGGHNIGGATAITNLNFQSGTLQNVGEINNGAALTKTTAGTLTVAGTNNYTGATNVAAGTVIVSGSLTATSASTVSAGARLIDNGSIANTVTVNGSVGNNGIVGGVGSITGSLISNSGTVAPGLGTLTVTGILRLDSASTFSASLGGTGAGHYSQLSATGIDLNPDSGTGASLQLSLVNGYVPAQGDFFVIGLNNSSVLNGVFGNTGTDSSPLFFGGAQFTSISVNGYEFAVSYNSTATTFFNGGVGGGNDIALLAVPEPNTAAILAAGLGTMAGLGRFRRRRS